jgi:hypothetical protein
MRFAKRPIINLLGDDQSITIQANEYATQTVTYLDGEAQSEALEIRTKCFMQGETEQSHSSFRYKTNIRVVVEILFYANSDNDVDEQKQVIVLFPNNQYEKKKILPFAYDVPINNYYIHSISCTLYNLSTTPLVVNKMTIRRQVSEAEDYAENTGINNNTLDEVQAYDNGCKLYYTNQTDPTTLVFVDDGSGNLIGVDVNPGTATYKRISFNKNSGDIPQN